MLKLLDVGRVVFATALMFFGIQYLVYAAGRTWPIPGPPWTPGGLVVAGISGIGLLVAGVCIAIGKQARTAASLVALALLVRVVLIHLPRLLSDIHDPGPWTSTFEILALAAGTLVLTGALPGSEDKIERQSVLVGRVLFAFPLIVFGVQHFMYARFIATLIPSWIPGRLFWAYFVGVAFIATAAAIKSGKQASLAAMMLGIMFGLWFVLLHLPRVVAASHNGNEWTSAFIALAMCGSSWIVAGAMGKEVASRS
jgi:uncharacterized membrane protein YphA (DoxX/SURF4 family)